MATEKSANDSSSSTSAKENSDEQVIFLFKYPYVVKCNKINMTVWKKIRNINIYKLFYYY